MTRNLHLVASDIYRSGRYTATDLRTSIVSMGIRVIVDLRDAYRPSLVACRTFHRLGFAYERVPIDERAPMTTQAFEAVYSLVHGQPSLVHCWKGAHRTGAWAAWYRVRVQGWTVAMARDEMARLGFGDPDRHRELWDSVEDACRN